MKSTILTFLLLLTVFLHAQPEILFSKLAHTYSIVAIDRESGQMGVAVQSHWFNVGSIVSWAEPGVGVVATQSLVDPDYGRLGILLMKEGKSAPDALKALLAADPAPEVRQVAMIDVAGNVASHTGKLCIAEAGFVKGENFSCQANLMKKNTVWEAMAKAFRESRGELADRLLAALKAAEAEGGDIRGKQSAALKVVSIHRSGIYNQDYIYDIRVDDSEQPLEELERLLNVAKSYQYMNWGDYYMEKQDITGAMQSYQKAMQLQPDNVEMKYWYAITMVSIGKLDEVKEMLREVFRKEPDWKEVTRRLVQSKLFPDDPELLNKVLSIE